MVQPLTFQQTLIRQLEDSGFIKNATIGSEFVYERSHPNEPMLRVVVYTGIRYITDSYPMTSVKVATILFTPRREYAIVYPYTVRIPQDPIAALAVVMKSIDFAHNRGCLWYDKKNGTNTASGEEARPQMGGYQKMECRKTPLDKL